MLTKMDKKNTHTHIMGWQVHRQVGMDIGQVMEEEGRRKKRAPEKKQIKRGQEGCEMMASETYNIVAYLQGPSQKRQIRERQNLSFSQIKTKWWGITRIHLLHQRRLRLSTPNPNPPLPQLKIHMLNHNCCENLPMQHCFW